MYKITEKKSSEVTLEVTIEAEKLKKVTDMVTEELSASVKVAGFRPGKAPQYIVEREVGKDKFWAEVIDKAIPEAFYEAVVVEKLVTVANPEIKLKTFVPGENLVFEAKVAVLPELGDLKYKNLGIKPIKAKVEKKDLDTALMDLANKMTEQKLVERAAKMGERVEIDFEGTLKGLPFDGGKSENHPVVLGSNSLIPGFEEKIVGHKKGDEFDFDINFPNDYHAKNLAGQKANFKVKVKEVAELMTPKIDDELAKKYEMPDVAKLKEVVQKELEFQKELEAKRQTEEEMIERIIKENKIEAPSVLVKEQIHQMVHEAEHNLSNSGLTMDKFLEMSKKTLAELEEEMKPEAEKRVKIGIVLGEISRLEKIEVVDADVEGEMEKILATAGPETNKDDLKAAYETPERQKEIKNGLIIRKTLEKLWEYNIHKKQNPNVK